jgi:hypothetical protein
MKFWRIDSTSNGDLLVISRKDSAPTAAADEATA